MSLTYINPVELLNLSGVPITSIEPATIKKERKKLLADLDFGDGIKDYKGQRLDRSACERACAELDEPEHLRVWHRLANMPALNDFLGNGLSDFLLNPASAASLSADTNMLRLVGPRYAVQYDQALLSAFRAQDLARVQQVAAAPALYLPSESRQAHQSLSRLLREKLEEVREQTDSFDDDDNADHILASLTQTLSLAGWPMLLNALPIELFGGLRTDLAMAVRNFAIQFHNTFFEQTPALKLLQEAATLQLDGQSADRVREDIRQIREIEAKKLAREEVDKVSEQLLIYQKQVKTGRANMRAIRKWGLSLSDLINKLNTSTNQEIVTVRDSLALMLRGLSVSIWNNNQDNGRTAIVILKVGLTLKASALTLGNLEADRTQLAFLTRTDEAGNSRTFIARLIMSAIVLFFLYIIFGDRLFDNSKQSGSNSAPTNTETAVTPPTTAVGGNAVGKGHYVYDVNGNPVFVSETETSKYAGNQLRNGASPLDNCFGKGRYAGPAWVNFKNDNNDTDAIVCLAQTSNNKVIRNEYVRAGTSFRMSRIPAGSYYLKVFYGHDWNPTRKSACGMKGYFDSDQRFSESRAAGDLVNIEVSSRSYTTGTMTLYSVAGGNMAQQSIDATEFFRQ